MSSLYWPAILAAALSSFVLGGLWYSPMLFGKAWNRENGGVPPPGHPARVFGAAFVFSLGAAWLFALWLGPSPSADEALRAGAIAGGLVAACFGINYQFAQRSLRLWLIDGGYHFVQCLLFGLIIGRWH